MLVGMGMRLYTAIVGIISPLPIGDCYLLDWDGNYVKDWNGNFVIVNCGTFLEDWNNDTVTDWDGNYIETNF